MIDYQFIKCSNPRHITNRYTGEVVLAECGKCEACLLKKNVSRKSRCLLENAAHRYCYFVTLTYANKYLPQCTLVEKKKTKMAVTFIPSLKTRLTIPFMTRIPTHTSMKHVIMMENIWAKCTLNRMLTK